MTVLNKGLDTVLTIQLFGELHVSVDAQPVLPPPLKVQQLLALLVLGHEQPHSRAWLAEMLWPGSPSQRQMLRSALFALRRSLGDAATRLPEENRKTLRFDLSGASVDLLEFDRAIAIGEDEIAVRLYRGELLKGWPDEWAARERERRAQAYAGALKRLQGAQGIQSRAELLPGVGHQSVGSVGPEDPGVRRSAQDGASSESPQGVFLAEGTSEGPRFSREMARLRALVAESRTHLARAATALEQLERRVALLESEQSGRSDTNGLEGTKGGAKEAGFANTDLDYQSGQSFYNLAVAAMVRGDTEEAEDLFAEALAVFTLEPGDQAREADILHKLGGLAIRQGQRALARDYAERCRAIRAQMNDGRGMVGALLLLGDAADLPDQAVGHFEQALEVAKRESYPEGVAWSEISLAQAPLLLGTWSPDLLPETVRRFQRALTTFMGQDISTGALHCLDGIIRLLWAAGRRSEAVRLFSDCSVLRAQYKIQWTSRDLGWFRPLLEEKRLLSPSGSDGAAEAREELTLEQVARLARKLLRDLSRPADHSAVNV